MPSNKWFEFSPDGDATCVLGLLLSLAHDMIIPGGGGTPHMKGVGMLVGNFELNPKRRPIWAGPKLFLTLKRDRVKTQTINRYLYF